MVVREFTTIPSGSKSLSEMIFRNRERVEERFMKRFLYRSATMILAAIALSSGAGRRANAQQTLQIADATGFNYQTYGADSIF